MMSLTKSPNFWNLYFSTAKIKNMLLELRKIKYIKFRTCGSQSIIVPLLVAELLWVLNWIIYENSWGLALYVITVYTSLHSSNIHMLSTQMTLEQREFELRGSTCMWIFFTKYSTCIFILQMFKLTKCGGKLVLDLRSQYVESKELGFESWFYPNYFSFLSLGESFINSFVFEADLASLQISHCIGIGSPNPVLFKGQLTYFVLDFLSVLC